MTIGRKLVPLVAIASLTLAGCTDEANSETRPRQTITTTITTSAAASEASEDSEDSESSENEEPAGYDAALDAYRDVVANAAAYPVNPSAQYEPRGGYGYALVEATYDDVPELLVRVNGMEYSPVLIFSYDDAADEVIQTEEVLIDGAAGAGGGRSRVWASKDGSGIYQVDYHSIQPEQYSSKFEVYGESLGKVEDRAKFFRGQLLPDLQPLVWYDSDDEVGFDIIQGVGGAAPGADDLTGNASNTPPGDESTEESTYQFTGKVVIKTNAELPEHGGPANGEPMDEEHIIMVLDSPQEVTAQTVGPQSRTALMTQVVLHVSNSQVGIENSKWLPYVGERITIASNADDLRYPTDTTMPLGMLRVDGTVSD